ncbi:MAG: AIR carboxylase family protein, partial [Crocinitomicaceae bacterium]|nr:AIR carboxylase family protein [Crocinitomicaceae bacterium]
ILQMPGGIPVATVALNGAKNAGILAAKIIGAQQPDVLQRLLDYMESMKEKVLSSAADLNNEK